LTRFLLKINGYPETYDWTSFDLGFQRGAFPAEYSGGGVNFEARVGFIVFNPYAIFD